MPEDGGDPFLALPAELRIEILEASASLLSLHNMIHASPAMRASFTHCSPSIFNTVLKRTQVSDSLAWVMAAIVSLYSGTYSSQLYYDLLVHRMQYDDDVLEPHSHGAVLQMLKLTSDVHDLTHHLLAIFLHRTNTFPGYRHMAQPSDVAFQNPGAMSLLPDGVPYAPNISYQPSWIEYHRVSRALWRWQLTLLLAKEKDYAVDRDRTHHQPRLWVMTLDDAEMNELEIIGTTCEELPQRKEDHYHMDLSSIWQDLQRREVLATLPEPFAPTDGRGKIALDSLFDTRISSPGYRLFKSFVWTASHSPLRGKQWGPLRWLGFSFWDLERMSEIWSRSIAIPLLTHENRRTGTHGL